MGRGSSVAMSCGVGHRCSLDPALLWLWCRPAAVGPIRPLAWELPYAVGKALKRKKKKEYTLLTGNPQTAKEQLSIFDCIKKKPLFNSKRNHKLKKQTINRGKFYNAQNSLSITVKEFEQINKERTT